MAEARHTRRRSPVQIVLAVSLLLVVGLGSLAHVHAADTVRSSAASHCIACTLHTVVNPGPPPLEVAAAPLRPPPLPVVVATDPVDSQLGTLRIAPKTSPPRAA